MTSPSVPPGILEHFDAENPDAEAVATSLAFLETLSKALFPSGVPSDRKGLTWADSEEVAGLNSDGRIRPIEERLRAAEKRFSTLVEQIPAVTFMAVLGEGDNEVYVSPHVEQMLGYSQQEWLSDPFLWYYRLHPDDRLRWNEEFARGCRSGGPFRAECRFLARDGREVWVHGEARVVKDELGRPQFLQGVAFDITESKRAQALLLDSAVRQARIDEELEIAKRVQRALVPENPTLDGLEIAAIMEPADQVGGDYYDVEATPEGGWLAIGDVSGHGLNAGLVMLMLESAMQTVQRALPNGSPSEALAVINQVLFDNVAKRLGREDYVTLTLLRYERNGRVVFAGGHQDIVVFRAAERRVELVGTPGPWMAIIDRLKRPVQSEFELADGDLMVLFTDGIIEARDRDGNLFGIERLCEAIRVLADEPPERIRDGVVARVRSHLAVQEDDMTLLVTRFHASR
jgi:PAS domain S-box-containing protein